MKLAMVKCLTIMSVGFTLIPEKSAMIKQESKTEFPNIPSAVWDKKTKPTVRSLEAILSRSWVTAQQTQRAPVTQVALFSS